MDPFAPLLTTPEALVTRQPVPGEIHTIFTRSDQGEESHALLSILSPQERDRAKLFHFEKDRRSFVVGRGLVRIALGYLLGIGASEVIFDYTEKGKPILASGRAIQFNLSHSGGAVLLGISVDMAVGVDVERMRTASEDQIARRFFSPAEYEKIRSLPESERVRGFFACWTRKEAFVKACGAGLSYSLNSFEVTLLPREAPAVVQINGDHEQARQWTVLEIDAGEGYVAACVAESRGKQVVHHHARYCG